LAASFSQKKGIPLFESANGTSYSDNRFADNFGDDDRVEFLVLN
jgi:hypothetical protein